MNNYEKIKEMSIEEMSNLADTVMSTLCRNYCKGCKESKYSCKEAMKKLLESKAI